MDAWDLVVQAFEGAWDAKATRPRFGIAKTGRSRVGDAVDFDPVSLVGLAGGAKTVGSTLAGGALGRAITKKWPKGFAEKKAPTTAIGKLLTAPGKAGRAGVAPGRGGVAWPPLNAASRSAGRPSQRAGQAVPGRGGPGGPQRSLPGSGRPVGMPIRNRAQAPMTGPRKGTVRAGVARGGPSTWPVR